MHHHGSNRKKLIKIIATYTGMTIATIAIVTFIVLFVLGFRFDATNSQIEQYAFLQFNTAPTGAMVAVDDKVISGRTPNKTSVPEGTHEIVVWREGYETWRKTLYLKAGTLTWLNYILMVPTKLSVESIFNYTSLFMSLASPMGKYMIAQQNSNDPTFDLSDLSIDAVKTTQLTIPKKYYSEAYTSSEKHVFKIVEWDQGERYLLIQHNYNDKIEWLVIDSQNMDNTKNITKLYDLLFSNVKFSGNGGNILFALESGNIRKLDLNAETISKPLVSKIEQFNLYDQNIITYVGYGDAGTRTIGLYRDGDNAPYAIRTIASDNVAPLQVVSTHYFNDDYIVVAEGKKVDILQGNYRNSMVKTASDLKLIKSFDMVDDVKNLGFSPVGQYILAQSGANFSSYDLEYQNLVSSTVGDTTTSIPLKWLNDSYFWSDNGGNLNIREFDGTNPRVINPVVAGQDAAMTHNGRYLYSFNQVSNGYELQRVRMVLP